MRTVFGFLAFFASSALLSQAIDIPVTNWTVPPWTGSSGGITTMTDFTPPRVFVAVVPCRVVDTRNPVGPYGGPALATNVARTFDIDNGPCPGLPAGIEAYSLSFGAILPPADGFLTAWPTGTGQPVFSQVNLIAGEVVANAAIVPAGTNGAINVLVNIGPTHVYIDINGYFSDVLGNPQNQLRLVNSSDSPTAVFENNSTTCLFDCGIFSETRSGTAMVALTRGTSGVNFGVVGSSLTLTAGSAGVRGLSASTSCGEPTNRAGVLGTTGAAASFEIGVIGIGDFEGVRGINTNGCVSNVASFGSLGYTDTTAVFGQGNLNITGMKNFVDPHPRDASKMISYVSLEGPEAGTYFRGRGKFQNGTAVIEVPESFRLVTDAEGLSIQVTPIGRMATVAVQSIGLDRIVVLGSRNVEFFYTVNGVRSAFRDHEPIQENSVYVPASEGVAMIGAWSAEQKRRLVANGTFNPDGTVNLETARRLGWERAWAEREGRPAPEPTPQ